MTIRAIEERAKKLGYKIMMGQHEFRYISLNGKILTYWPNGRNEDGTPSNEVAFIQCQRENDTNDSQSDYTGGFFSHSIKKAFDYLVQP